MWARLMGREPLTVLVVDRDLDYASAITTTLRSEGHEVHVAPTGPESIEIARTSRFDCVLLDLFADGECFAVARMLRDGILSRTSAIILLTDARTPSVERADAAGIDLVLTKPVMSEYLSGLIRQVLSVRRRKLSPSTGAS